MFYAISESPNELIWLEIAPDTESGASGRDDIVLGPVGEAGDVLGPVPGHHQDVVLAVAAGAGQPARGLVGDEAKGLVNPTYLIVFYFLQACATPNREACSVRSTSAYGTQLPFAAHHG